MIRLRKTETYRYRGQEMNYLVTYDHGAGFKGRYTVIAVGLDEPTIIGRELDLGTARRVIANYEQFGNPVGAGVLSGWTMLRGAAKAEREKGEGTP